MTPYALYVPAGSTGPFHDVLSPSFANFLPGLPLYFSFDYAATRTTGAASATLHVEIRWYDATGSALTPWTNDIILNATLGDTLQKFTVIPPAGATSGKCYIKITPAASPMQHDVWIKKLRLGKTEISATNGANWASNVSSRPINLAALSGSEGVNNALVSIGSNGALTGGGGGQVTLPGIAPNVDAAASAADNILRNANFSANADYWTLSNASVMRVAGTNTAPPRLVFTCDGTNPRVTSEVRPIPVGARKLFLSFDMNRTSTNFGAAVYLTVTFFDAAGGATQYTNQDFYGNNNADLVHLKDGVPVTQLVNAWMTSVYTNIVVPIQAVAVQIDLMSVNGVGETPAPTLQMTNIRLSPTAPAADLTSLNSVVTSSDIGAGAADNLIKNALFQQLDAAGNVAFWKLSGTGSSFQTSSTAGEPPKYIRCTNPADYVFPNVSNANASTGVYQANTGIAMWPGGPKKIYASARVRTQGFYLAVVIYFFRAGGYVGAVGAALQPTASNVWQECTGIIDASAFDFDAYQVYVSNVVGGYNAEFADLRLAFTERSATLGAIWNGNIVGTPSNLGSLSGSEGINNGLVAIGSNGALTGGGGGQVTIGGLGYSGALNATYGATWGGNITGSNMPIDNAGRVLDTRSADDAPSVYYAKGMGEYQEFKSYNFSSTLTAAVGFAHLITVVQWTDASGGPVKQTLTDSNGQIFERVSTGTTTWGAWSRNYNGAYRPRLGGDVLDSGGSSLGDADVRNNYLSVGSNGALLGGGGGQVTIGGLGYTGDLNASYGATWGGNITSRPGNLSALTGSEVIQNTSIGISSGIISGIGTGNSTAVGNALVSIGSNGALTGGGGGQVTIGGLGYTGELNADLTTEIVGAAAQTLTYDYTGATIQGGGALLGYYLRSGAGQVTDGTITATMTVKSGTVLGFTEASGAQALTVTSGIAALDLTGNNAVTSATASVVVGITRNGVTRNTNLDLTRVLQPTPASSGGGSGGTPTTQTSGFGGPNDTSVVAISNTLSYTTPTGKTATILTTSLLAACGNQTPSGTWTVNGKWQRNTGTSASPIWTDVPGTACSGTSSRYIDGDTRLATQDKASLSVAGVSDTGLTQNTTYEYRFVGWLTTGTRSHSCSGSVSITS